MPSIVFTHIVKNRYTLIEQSPRLARFNFMPLLTYLAFSYGYQNVHFYNIWLYSYNYIHKVYGYYSYITSYLYWYLHTETIHISFMWYTAFMYSCTWYFVYCYTWSCGACWVLLLERAFSSVLLNVQESCTCSTTCVL